MKPGMVNNPILKTLSGTSCWPPPVWLMRQAGRYLPEYRAFRERFPDFLSFCYTPQAACEVTLQPLQRFDMDAAILFSDILVIPDALGQRVGFVKGEGPKLEPLRDIKAIARLQPERAGEYLEPVMQAIRHISSELPPEKALIGFAGAPWTLACYMIEGGGSKDFVRTRAFAHTQPEAFTRLIDILTQAVSDYAARQIEAGAQVIQLFDSWAGLLPEADFYRFVIAPTKHIVAQLKAQYPQTPLIGFARGGGANLIAYADETGLNALGLDQMIPLHWAKTALGHKVLQGNLDNVLLAANRDEAVRQTRRILETWRDLPFIFNLGHGVLPHTPIAHVQAVIETIRETTQP